MYIFEKQKVETIKQSNFSEIQILKQKSTKLLKNRY